MFTINSFQQQTFLQNVLVQLKKFKRYSIFHWRNKQMKRKQFFLQDWLHCYDWNANHAITMTVWRIKLFNQSEELARQRFIILIIRIPQLWEPTMRKFGSLVVRFVQEHLYRRKRDRVFEDRLKFKWCENACFEK